jgi:hypothetical protein
MSLCEETAFSRKENTVKKLFLLAGVACLALMFAASAFARDARLDYLVNQGKVTEEEIAAAEMEGPNNWMAKSAYDIYISGWVQVGWYYVDGGDPDNEFTLNHARLKIMGKLGEAWGFVVSPEFAGGAALTDVGAWYNFGDGKIFAGQTKVPIVLENMTFSNHLDTINRSEIATQLDDRDLGLFLDYGLMEGKVGIEAAATNGTGTNAAETNDAMDYTIRVWGKPFMGSENPADGLLVAAAYSMGEQQELDANGVDVGDFDRTIYVGTVQWFYEGIKVQGEYVNIEQDVAAGGSNETDGWYALASYDLPVDSMVVTPVAKYEVLDGDVVTGGEWITLGVRISFVGTHDVKLDANYIMEDLDTGEDVDEFILQLTASY